MKKTALILLICIYALATMGFTVSQFYCCGRLKSVSLTIVQHFQGECKKGNDKGRCCQSKFQFYKVGDKHFATDISSSSGKYYSSILSQLFYKQIIFPAIRDAEITNKNHAPPSRTGVPAYILNCDFRI